LNYHSPSCQSDYFLTGDKAKDQEKEGKKKKSKENLFQEEDDTNPEKKKEQELLQKIQAQLGDLDSEDSRSQLDLSQEIDLERSSISSNEKKPKKKILKQPTNTSISLEASPEEKKNRRRSSSEASKSVAFAPSVSLEPVSSFLACLLSI